MQTKQMLIPVLLLTLATGTNAESLWLKAERDSTSIYADHRAHRVGDIVTVVIEETASITKEKTTEMSKAGSTDFELELFRMLGLDDASHPRASDDTPAAKWKSQRDFKGEADHETTEEFSKTMAAIVIEVLPNSNNLLIEGSSDIVTDEDITTVTVTGTIRRQDITQTNTVSSQKILNARINYQAKGPLKQNTSKGWLTGFLDAIWPF